jgi:low temperature requirement protein LtrA
VSVRFWSGLPAAERRVTWAELFFDLVFVAAVAQVGAPLAEHYSFAGIGRYAFLLLVIWWAWNGYAVYATRFDADAGVQRILTLAQMAAVIFMAANAEEGLDTASSAGFAAAYAVMRLILVGQYLRAATIAAARRLALEHAIGYGVAALIWLTSALVEPPLRYACWGLALGIDIATAIFVARHTRRLPPHASHLPERFGLFTLILLGEAIVATMKGIQSQPIWTASAAATAFGGIGLIFFFWWAYFDAADATAHRQVRSRRDARTFEVWNYAHLPLYLGLALTGVGVEHAVRLGGTGTLHDEERWVLASAVTLACASLAVLAATRSHQYASDVTPDDQRHPSNGRGLIHGARRRMQTARSERSS